MFSNRRSGNGVRSGASNAPKFRNPFREFTLLEDRLTPAAYQWEPELNWGTPIAPLNWNSLNNWMVKKPATGNFVRVSELAESNPDRRYPGAGDTVEFRGGNGDYDCFANTGATLLNMTVTSGYTKKITLVSPLTIAPFGSSTTVGSFLSMQSASATLGGTSEATASLTIAGGSFFRWNAGKLGNLGVTLGSAESDDATMTVYDAAGAGAGARSMHGTAINVVKGRLGWGAGNVDVTNGAEVSSINVGPNGRFEIVSDGRWGWAPGLNPNFAVSNAGLIQVDNANATLNANFLNTADVFVGWENTATLTIGGEARQTAGWTVLGDNIGQTSGTITLTGPGTTLQIQDGGIGGKGTVNGNLTLGYDPNGPIVLPAAPVLVAGPNDAIGDLVVTQSFHIFVDCATVQVKVGDDGQTSKLVVQGPYAIFQGGLSIEWANTNPPALVKHVLVDIAGTRYGEFDNFVEDGRAENQGIRFKTTYLGGTGNDVALHPLMNVTGAVWNDRNLDKAMNSYSPIEPLGWRNENPYWFGYGYYGIPITVVLTGGELDEPITTVTAHLYEFRDLPVGNYTLTFRAPEGEEYHPEDELPWLPAGYVNTNIPGYIGSPTVVINVTPGEDETVIVGDVGFAIPMMRVTVSGVAYTDPEDSGPDISILNGTFLLLYCPGDVCMNWTIIIPPTSTLSSTAAAVHLRVYGNNVIGEIYRIGTVVSRLYGTTGFGLSGATTVTLIPSNLPQDAQYTVPLTLTFTPVHPT